MNNYCRDIEAKIVDYTEDMLNASQREVLLTHIRECVECRRKFEEFSESVKYADILKSNGVTDDTLKDVLFEKVKKGADRKRLFIRLSFAVAMILFIIVSLFAYSQYSYNYRLKEALKMEYSVEYFVDLEEEIINSDDETFETLSAIIYGEEYKDFEDVLEETSIIKP